jgi:hypothetical protein
MAQQRERIVVIADPEAQDGDRLRHSYWDSIFGDYPIEQYGLADLDKSSTVLDLKGAKLLVVSWDSANGDAAYGSSRTLQYFQSEGRVRVEELLMDGGVVLSECQTLKGVPVQAAYDAIFGRGELTVLSDILPEPERRGDAALTADAFADHPILLGMPRRVTQNYRDLGERMFYPAIVGPESTTRPVSELYRTSLWFGYFTHWRKGWIPLLYADLPASYVRRVGWKARPAAVLLAKVHRNGILLASTLFIAGAQFTRLIDNLRAVDMTAVRRHHESAVRRRVVADVAVGVLVALLLVAAIRLLIWALTAPPSSIAFWLASVSGVGGIPLVMSVWNGYKRAVWGRPFGFSVIRALIRSL